MKTSIFQKQENRFSCLVNRSIIILILTLLVFNLSHAQDKIYTKTGQKISCKITSIDSAKIMFNTRIQNGNTINTFIAKNEVADIKYGTGAIHDIIYLKNGSIIKGTIIDQVPKQSIKIKTRDGNLLVYNAADIEKTSTVNYSEKKPVVAFLWSALLIPGAGQFYNGQCGKGIIMSVIDIAASVELYRALNDYTTITEYGISYKNWNGGEATIVCLGVMLADAIWSDIDAPVSANAINRRNRAKLTYKLDRNINLALMLDYKLDCLGGKVIPEYGAKLSFNFH